MRAAAATLLTMLLLPAAAAAQPAAHGYVEALGGVATASATDGVFGGTAAVHARGPVDVFVEMGRLRNGIWSALDRELSSAAASIRDQIANQFGSPSEVSFDARVPIVYGLAGARVRGPQLGSLGTFVEGAIGLSRLRPETHLTINGSALDDEAGRLLRLGSERSAVMSAVGGGVSVRVLRVIRIEGGYRVSHAHGDVPFTFGRVHAGVGYAF